MTEVLVKNSDLKPVSFDKGLRGLTVGQCNLMEMLIKHLNEGISITKDDIIDCYVKSVAVNGMAKRLLFNFSFDDDNNQPNYKNKIVDITKRWDTKGKAMIWFKQNLGACIIKGKLLAIPIINMD